MGPTPHETNARRELVQRAADLNARFADCSAATVLEHAISKEFKGSIAIVSSFGAESAAVLLIASAIDSAVPVIFLDTLRHFPETLDYVDRLTAHLGLSNVRIAQPAPAELEAEDPRGDLYIQDPDRCCYVRKTLPMVRALNTYRAWVTGRKRYQSGDRRSLQHFEVQDQWLKVNPLAAWSLDDVRRFIADEKLPPHPLVVRGFPSIGCSTCTKPVKEDDPDTRAGRWSGSAKIECGIHFGKNPADRLAE